MAMARVTPSYDFSTADIYIAGAASDNVNLWWGASAAWLLLAVQAFLKAAHAVHALLQLCDSAS